MIDILGPIVVLGTVVLCILDMLHTQRQERKDEDKEDDQPTGLQ